MDVILGGKSSKNLIRVHEIDKIPRIRLSYLFFYSIGEHPTGKILRRNVQFAKKLSYIAILKWKILIIFYKNLL